MSISLHHIFYFVAISDMFDDMIDGTFVRLFFMVFALPWLTVPFSVASAGSV